MYELPNQLDFLSGKRVVLLDDHERIIKSFKHSRYIQDNNFLKRENHKMRTIIDELKRRAEVVQNNIEYLISTELKNQQVSLISVIEYMRKNEHERAKYGGPLPSERKFRYAQYNHVIDDVLERLDNHFNRQLRKEQTLINIKNKKQSGDD